MGWKKSLDRYLTTPPDNGFDVFCEQVYDHVIDEVYDHMEENDFINSDIEIDWLTICFDLLPSMDLNEMGEPTEYGDPDMSPKKTAKLISQSYVIKQLFL